MLKTRDNALQTSTNRDQTNLLPQLDLLSIVRVARRRLPSILLFVLLGLVLSALYLFSTPNRYSASALLLIDEKDKASILSRQDDAYSQLPDPGIVESQVEVIKSDSVASAVVKTLHLSENSKFMNVQQPIVSRVIGTVTGAVRDVIDAIVSIFISKHGGGGQPDLDLRATEMLKADTKVKRIGTSYVIEISYRGSDPALTANIANGIAEAYIHGEMNTKYRKAELAVKWLEDRLVELQERTSTADLAVQRFKADNNIVDTSRGLISDQQLSEINSQLVTARAATAEAKARFDRISEVSTNDLAGSNVDDALRSAVITRLRAQFLDLSNRRTELARRYGKDHAAVFELDQQMSAINESISAELKRIASAAKSDYMIAAARETSLRASLSALIGQSDATNKSAVALRNLESAAQADRNLYDLFLQKLGQSTQEQTAPVSAARIITPAVPADGPSWPKPSLVLGGGLFMGAVAGFAVALLLEMFTAGFRYPEDVRDYAGLEYLGTLPRLASARTLSARGAAAKGVLGSGNTVARQSLLAPFSRFTETIRNIKVTVDLERHSAGTPIIGIISALPKEGKTTVSSNLAMLVAQMGHKTLLVDADLHNPSLTRTLAADAKAGLVAVLKGEGAFEDYLLRDSVSNLEFLPAGVSQRDNNASSLLVSQNMVSFLEDARSKHDYVILDLPPLLPVVDAKAVAHLVDHFVLVIEWDETTREAVKEALMGAENVRHQTLGAILNKADVRMLKRIESYRGPAYGSYYVDSTNA